MNFFKEDNWIRDLLFAILLLALIHHVVKDDNYTKVEVQPSVSQQAFTAHEVDPEIVARIDRLEEKLVLIHQELERLKSESVTAQLPQKTEELENSIKEIGDIQESVDAIKGEYQATSPALAFLGPIGSTSIVLKEKQLEKKLLESINQAISIWATLTNTTDWTDATNINQAEQDLIQAINSLKNVTYKKINPFEGIE